MKCTEAREHLLDRRREEPDGERRAHVDEHLATCEACQREEKEDQALSRALETLPLRRAPAALRARITAQLASAAPVEGRASAGRGSFAKKIRGRGAALTATGLTALAAAAAVLVWKPGTPNAMVAEAVNDHLRVLYSEHPIEIESGGVHQVKPWFEGRVDFAPLVGFGGDDDFPLQGGAIAYFLDRKAAAYVYKRRLHLITLFVFRADGLPWPATSGLGGRAVHLGHANATEATVRGFHALVWRDGDLGYSLVSDLETRELEMLGGKIAGP